MWPRKHREENLGKRMKICFVGWANHVHLERWAGYFASPNYEVTVISFAGLGHYPAGVHQYPVGLENRGMRWKEPKLRYLLWKIKPDLVHVHWADFAYPVARAWAGPLVVTAWGSDIYRLDKHPRHVAERVISSLQAADA